jgi:hypothetical protein
MERKDAAVSTGVEAALLGMLIAEAEAIAIFDCGSGVWIQDGKPRHLVKTSCPVNFFSRLKDGAAEGGILHKYTDNAIP